MIIRAKNKDLFQHRDLTQLQLENQALNLLESEQLCPILQSFPRRIVCELTNACNLSCIMCGRNAIDFHPTKLKKEWLIKLSKLFSHSEEVTLMGWGEPTVHPQFVDILRYLTQFPLKNTSVLME